ncbi:DNA polymerase III subunit gamma and tau, partial [Streptomyces sp. ISL-36]|nr:DNA polymerase III subunit gamma and tau [Streptomyces sp. ISL-36]
AWPGAATPGAGTPGAWPGASAPAPQAAPAPAPTPQAPAPTPAAAGGDMAQGAAQVRNMWQPILDAVKNRRRFTWILLSQNAQVAGFDGTTLQLGFLNAGARDNFASSGSEEVLKQVLAEQFNVQWKIEAIIDPSGGVNPPPAAANFGGGRPAQGYAQGSAQGPGPGSGQGSAPAAPPQQQWASASASAQQGPAQQSTAPASVPPAQQYRSPAPAPVHAPPAPRPVAPEDDVPEEDDPDLVDSALSGHDLIVRELGATVLEEYTNE